MLTDDYDELVFFRSIAAASLKLENAAYVAMKKDPNPKGGPNASEWTLHNPGFARKDAEGKTLEEILEMLTKD